LTGDDEMEIEPVIFVLFEPPGKKPFRKSQNITRTGASLDSLYSHKVSVPVRESER
jgi:hypothetical protein